MPDWMFVTLLLAAEVATPLVLAVLVFVLARWSVAKDERTLTVKSADPHTVGSLISVSGEGVFEVKSVKGGGPYTVELRKAE